MSYHKTHWVCLKDRQVAKSQVQRICPICREPMIDFGFDFKAPRKQSDNQWRKLEVLHQKGIHFHSCGCTGPGHRPRTLAEAKALA